MDSNNAMIIAENIQQPTATDIVSLDVNITDNNSSTSVATSLASTSNISIDPALVVVSSSSTLTATGIVGNDSQHIIQMVTESPQQQQQPPPPQSTTETNVNDNQLLQQSTVMINDNNSTPTSTSIFAAAPVTTSITTTAVPASVQLPIKITGSTQPIFVSNQGIIAAAPTGTTNVSTLANTFVSYILPTQNSIQKSSLPKSDNQSTTTIVSAAPNISTETVSTTALINTPIVINAPVSDTTSIQPQKLATSTNPANVKLIQSTNQRHLVFSPIKPTIGNVVGNTTLMTKSIAGTKSNQRIVDGNKTNTEKKVIRIHCKVEKNSILQFILLTFFLVNNS